MNWRALPRWVTWWGTSTATTRANRATAKESIRKNGKRPVCPQVSISFVVSMWNSQSLGAPFSRDVREGGGTDNVDSPVFDFGFAEIDTPDFSRTSREAIMPRHAQRAEANLWLSRSSLHHM